MDIEVFWKGGYVPLIKFRIHAAIKLVNGSKFSQKQPRSQTQPKFLHFFRINLISVNK